MKGTISECNLNTQLFNLRISEDGSQTTFSTISRSKSVSSIYGNTDEQNPQNLIRLTFPQMFNASLSPNLTKMCKLFLRKNQNELNQDQSAFMFKDALNTVLDNISGRIPEESAERNFIHLLQHELKNRFLINVFTKYYSSSRIHSQTILDELSPYLGNKEKIEYLNKNEIETLPAKIISDLEPKAVNRDGLMSLMIKLKKDKSPNFVCYVIDFYELEIFLKNYKFLEKTSIVNLLVRTDVHYTAVVIEYKDNNSFAVVMDAAGDSKCTQIASLLEETISGNIYVLGLEDRIQYDNCNCAFFSLESVWKCFKETNFFENLKRLPNRSINGFQSIAWANMPPHFVKNATSTSFMERYPAKDTIYKNGETFEKYVNSHVGSIDLGKGPKKIHTVLETKMKKQSLKIQDMVNALTPNQLMEIINQSSIQEIFI